MSDNTCRACNDRPAGTAFVCAICGDLLTEVLAETPWLVDELNMVVTRQTRYGNRNGGRSSDKPLAFDVRASDVLATLNQQITSWVLMFAEENPGWSLPQDTTAAKARWLQSRVTMIRHHDQGGECVRELCETRATGLYAIDRPAERQFLGKCSDQNHAEEATEGHMRPAQATTGNECPGRVYGRPNALMAKCDTCGTEWQAEALRQHLLAQLDDRLCTAAEIARLSTHLGLQANRDQVRKRVNTWHARKRITAEGIADGDPTFRFGIVWRLLAHEDARKAS